MMAEEEEKLCFLLKDSLKSCNVNVTRVKVCRKTKDLDQGDFFVPKGVLNFDLNSETAKAVQLESSIQQATAGDPLPISSVRHDKHNSITFHIDRPKAYSNIIQRVLCEGEKYGHQASREKEEERRVVVNPVDLQIADSAEEEPQDSLPSLTQLRAVVLLKHVLCLLIANGYEAQATKLFTSEDMRDLLNVMNMDIGSCQKTAVDESCWKLTQQAEMSPFREKLQAAERRKARRVGDGGEGKGEGVVVNLRAFMETSGLLMGKGGFDKNLNLLDVRLEDGTVSDAVKNAAMMESVVSASESQDEGGSGAAVRWLHLVSQSLSYTQQQADLLWRMCVQHAASSSIVQHHLVFGTIGGRKSSASAAMDAKEFYNVRHRQMTQAAMMKYGDHDQGPAWDDMIQSLTLASLTFDLLSTAASSQVHVDLSEEEGDSRSGPFVMYNCARLASLLQAFDQQVDQGAYPPLPDVGDINFQLLREEEEWVIVLLYIHAFPRLVQETVQCWNPKQGIAACIDTHKICHFLLNFSKTLSSYYSRYHILGGSEPHLLPLMFSRLTLMKAAHQVLCNGLRLVGLQPLSQL